MFKKVAIYSGPNWRGEKGKKQDIKKERKDCPYSSHYLPTSEIKQRGGHLISSSFLEVFLMSTYGMPKRQGGIMREKHPPPQIKGCKRYNCFFKRTLKYQLLLLLALSALLRSVQWTEAHYPFQPVLQNEREHFSDSLAARVVWREASANQMFFWETCSFRSSEACVALVQILAEAMWLSGRQWQCHTKALWLWHLDFGV